MPKDLIHPIRIIGPLFESSRYKDTKDPCVLFDGTLWHIYGSGGEVRSEEWKILHATAPHIEGPWTEQEPAQLAGVSGPHVAAPSVIFDPSDQLFHMSVQKDFMALGGGIEYLVSADGTHFTRMATLLSPEGTAEGGLYDPHFSLIGDQKYLIYAGIPALITYDKPFIPQPDVYLAKSRCDALGACNLWSGPWDRMKKILSHEDIAWHHNRLGHPDYEWGIEGPQLLGLPDGSVLLNATCFLEEGRRGTRQRVFFAHADKPEGPYDSFGPVLSKFENEWESGENGHASVFIFENKIYLFYQARSQLNPIATENRWRYGLAIFDIEPFLKR